MSKLSWFLKHLKGEGNEKTQLKIEQVLTLVPPSQLRDIAVAERSVGNPLPKEMVKALEGLSGYTNRMKTYEKVFQRFVKHGDMVVDNSETCSYCNGLKISKNFYGGPRFCYHCNGKGTETKYKWIGPVI